MKSQKELKARYAEILASDVWRNDKSMVDFCVKKAGYIVELLNGDIVVIEKPSIEKDFCFGYHDSRYDTESYDAAEGMVDHARTSTDYFMRENLKDIEEMLRKLNGKRESYGMPRDFYVMVPYYGQPADSKLKAIRYLACDDPLCEGATKLEGIDLKMVIDGYKEVKKAFEKRLHTYLKRYGLSKVHAWSYWADV